MQNLLFRLAIHLFKQELASQNRAFLITRAAADSFVLGCCPSVRSHPRAEGNSSATVDRHNPPSRHGGPTLWRHSAAARGPSGSVRTSHHPPTPLPQYRGRAG